MSIGAVREYITLLWKRYQTLKLREDKALVLDEIERNLGVHRKSATRLMRAKRAPRLRRGTGRGGRQRYSDAARQHLVKLWAQLSFINSKRLRAALPDWLPHYQDETCTDKMKAELLAMSASTIERILHPAKAERRRRLNTATRRPPMITTHVPLRNRDFVPDRPGYFEIDTVSHAGGRLTGSHLRTLTVTDIVSGWTENEALLDLTGMSVKKALEVIEARLPFAILGIYFDGGSEFNNHDVVDSFITRAGRKIEIDFGRGRPYRKNDQCHVEQKNWTHVREMVGYDRLNGEVMMNAMNTIYRKEWRDLHNLLLPQSKLVAKWRIGGSLKRRMDVPRTPLARLLDHPTMTAEAKATLLARRAEMDPFAVRTKLAGKLQKLARIIDEPWQKAYRGRYHGKP